MMAVKSALFASFFIFSFTVMVVDAKIIKECDGIVGSYIQNPDACSEFIYCDGENSIYCSGDCRDELDCDKELSTAATSTTSSTITSTAAQLVDGGSTDFSTATATATPTTATSSTVTATATATAATSSTTTTIREQCKKGIYGKYPFPSNCNYYYDCLDGFLMMQQCPFGTGWDVNTMKCMQMKKAHCVNDEESV